MNRTLTIVVLSLTAGIALAASPKPTCDEAPERRDCIKVEDPNAVPPKPTVNRNKPTHPIARPLPATGGQGNAGAGKSQ